MADYEYYSMFSKLYKEDCKDYGVNDYVRDEYLDGEFCTDGMMNYMGCVDDILTAGEYKYSKDNPWYVDILGIALDALIIPAIIEVVTGKDIITGEKLSEIEREMNGVMVGIGIVTFGAGSLGASTGKAVIKNLIKEYAITVVSDSVATGAAYVAKDLGASDKTTLLVALLAGIGTSGGLSKRQLEELANKRALKVASNSKLKTGTGTSGEGLIIDDVPDGVLKDISPNESAVFGYSPNKGTRYDSPDYDFTNEDFARRNHAIRIDYLDGSETMKRDIEIMKKEGKSSQEIGEYCVNTRNQQKIDARSKMLPDEVKKLAEENIKRYQNPVGPSPQQQFENVKKKLIKNGVYVSDEQVWNSVIEGSMKKDDVINTLLGIKH